MDINQATGTFTVLISISFQWYDDNLNYAFLKNCSCGNEIDKAVEDLIWIPHYDFAYLMESRIISKRFRVEKENNPKMSGDIDKLHSSEMYMGAENSLKLSIFVQAKFVCALTTMNKRYPFGQDFCSFHVYLRDSQNLLVDLKLVGDIKNLGPDSFLQYTFKNWTGTETYLREQKLDTIMVKVQFGLKFMSIFMVTYLPTILMNILNQATNFITGESKYDLIFTINITSMMVLTSIYLSVSTSLPSTPNIKPIEIWLLCNLIYPFLVILINIMLQVKN